MPLYDYVCEKCNIKEEKLIPISKRNQLQKCKCGNNMKRLIAGNVGFKFIGDGFYSNHHLQKDLKKVAQKEKKWRKENVD